MPHIVNNIVLIYIDTLKIACNFRELQHLFLLLNIYTFRVCFDSKREVSRRKSYLRGWAIWWWTMDSWWNPPCTRGLWCRCGPRWRWPLPRPGAEHPSCLTYVPCWSDMTSHVTRFLPWIMWSDPWGIWRCIPLYPLQTRLTQSMSWQRLTRLHAGVNRIIFHDTYGNSHLAGLFATCAWISCSARFARAGSRFEMCY